MMENLIQQLIDDGYLKTPTIIKAFKKIKRQDFVLQETAGEAAGNYPLPIGYGQTISQPLTVAFMMELLAPEKDWKVLDIGSGSGFTTAILAEIVGKNGKVFALERIDELMKFGESNVRKYNFVKSGRAIFATADGTKGLKEEVIFDYLNKAYREFYFRPKFLVKQLVQIRRWQELVAKFKAFLAIKKV